MTRSCRCELGRSTALIGASQSLCKHPQTNTGRSGQFPRPSSETPNQAAKATAAHACPGAIEGCTASPRGPRAIPHGRLARTTATQPPAQLNEAALARGSGPFPDEEGLPAQPRLHYLATHSAGAAKSAAARRKQPRP